MSSDTVTADTETQAFTAMNDGEDFEPGHDPTPVADDEKDEGGDPKRGRRNFGRHVPPDRSPIVTHGEILGTPVVYVEIFGRIAEQMPPQDRRMVMDLEDWLRVRQTSEWWAIVKGSSGSCFVSRGKKALEKLANQSPNSNPNLPLSRLIMGAKEEERVMSVGGGYLDLRRYNLLLVRNLQGQTSVLAGAKKFARLFNETKETA